MQEKWKDILAWEGLYQISNFGRVKSLEKHVINKSGTYTKRKERILKPSISKGYYHVILHRDKFKKGYTVHRLVAVNFLIEHDKNLHINHKDGNKLNNHIENLEWCTQKENSQHAVKNGLYKPLFGEKAPRALIDKNKALLIISLLKSGFSGMEISEKTGTSNKIISSINTHTTWRHLTKDLKNPICDKAVMYKRNARRKSKIKNEDIKNIFHLRKQGKTQQAIADVYGVCQVYISDILKRYKDEKL